MDLSRAAWRTSSRSSGNGQCVEVATNMAEGVAVRDTKDRAGGSLVLTRAQWTTFLGGIRGGAFGPSA